MTCFFKYTEKKEVLNVVCECYLRGLLISGFIPTEHPIRWTYFSELKFILFLNGRGSSVSPTFVYFVIPIT
jgi:hypothetical protein